MARFKKHITLAKMEEIGLVPVFYHADLSVAKNVITACADGGASLIEFTNRGDFAVDLFGELERYVREAKPDVILGVGSIVDPYLAAMYIARGVNFVVGPMFNPDVAKICNRHMIPYMPGCGSATEIQCAQECGCDIVKVFPGDSVGGPSFVSSVKGPMPWTRIMPTGGVSPTKESITAWFNAGVTCVGIGSNLITKDIITQGNWRALTENVTRTRSLINEVRGAK